tara:strand:- start:329 stop:481 length:153 start_codon:yes stop_codon:yes gene_type:complete
MRSTQNPDEEILTFVAEAIILPSIFWGVILTARALKIACEMIDDSWGQKT